jgi:hypothetical protein
VGNEEEHEAANVFNPDEIVCDPALRKQINEYHPDVQDQVKRAYLLKGPTKPLVNFPKTGSGSRGFSKGWYDKYDWIEYSESHDKIIKSKLCNKLKNDWFNDLMICYTEREIFRQLDDGVISQRFQAMGRRRKHLPRKPRAN